MRAQPVAEEAERPPKAARGRLRWRIFGICGELALVVGVVLLGFIAYEMWGRVGELNGVQAQLDQELRTLWGSEPGVGGGPSAPDKPPAEGAPAAVLAIPKLGLRWTVVEGTTSRDLRHAPGHYSGTAMPGQIGNFAVAGHRMRGMFWDLDTIAPGDQVTVEDRTRRYVYEVDANRLVSPRDAGVLLPVPERPGEVPTVARLTLTTCNPKWDNYQRLIVEAHLVSSTAKGGAG
ncbi:class E sortase [Amycolatopsis sp. AA4]|uniref:class E sortase n=1 Tax=Actinomycetes TaxID=1760 RepID=UPI0001B545F5|nr:MULTISPECIES: class E sortase [Actinomycetes]ATY13977.1 class E sortase [Amycolatopsis sp. AA4]EFL09999.1 predicted protein [Streptomyces sp. AA4]